MILKSTPLGIIKSDMCSKKREKPSKKKSVISWLFLPMLLFLFTTEMTAQPCVPGSVGDQTFDLVLADNDNTEVTFDKNDIATEITLGANCCNNCGNRYIIFNQDDAPEDGDSGTSSQGGVTLDCDDIGATTMWIVIKGNSGLVYEAAIDSEPIEVTVNVTVNNANETATILSCGANGNFGLSEDANTADCYYTVSSDAFDAIEEYTGCEDAEATHDFAGAPSSTTLMGAMFPLGTTPINWTVTGGDGNTSTCYVEITVTDDTDPVLTCIDDVVLSLPASGEIDLNETSVQDQLHNITDCSSTADTSVVVSPSTLNCSAIGVPTLITITATYPSGNTSTCTTIIEIEDNTTPVALCKAVTVTLGAGGSGTLNAADMNDGSSDASDDCGLIYLVAFDNLGGGATEDSPDGEADGPFVPSIPFGCSDAGDVHNVILKVLDIYGNESTCNETVTVSEGGAPTAACMDFSISLDQDGEATIEASDLDDGSADACGDPFTMDFKVGTGAYATSHDFDCTDVTDASSSYVVTFRVTDDANSSLSNTCTATITINHAAPTAVCQNYTAVLDADGNATVNKTDLNDGSHDDCGDDITYEIAADTDGDGSADGDYDDSISYDCDQTGTHSVLLKVTDEFGKTDVCTATVTVSDDALPTVTCMDVVIQLDDNGDAMISGTDILDAVSDNCDVIQLTPSQTEFDCSDVGVKFISLMALDQNQNIGSCVASVTVEDNVDPVVITQDIEIILNSSGNASINSFQINNGSNDACGIASISASQTDFDCTDVGANTIVLTVTDNNNNAATGTAIVTVVDNIDPTASCMDISLDLNASGVLTVDADAVDNGSSDACGSGGTLIYTIAIDINEDGDANDGEVFLSSLEYGCMDVGDNYVIMRVTDDNENTAECDAMVSIQTVIEDVGLAVGEIEGCQTDIVKVPVTVSNFNYMLGLQADFTVMDATVGTVLGVTDLNLANLIPNNFVIAGNVVNLAWFNGDPTTVDDNTVIFNIEVELIGDPNPVDLTSAINITDAILGQELCGVLLNPGPAPALTNGSVDITCEPSTINLTGNVIKAGNLSPVNNVIFTLSGDVSGTQTGTLPSSSYDFIVDAGLNATITPTKTASPNSSNINIIDLLTIQSKILGGTLPVYKLIAADVTDDGSINILDLFAVQDFILGDPDFGAVDAWAFVPEDYVFDDPTDPTPQANFNSFVSYNPITADENDTFLAIEMGDVTDDPPAPFVGTDPMYFFLEDRPVTAGESYAVTFSADDFQDIAGYQFTLDFDTEFLSYTNTEVDQLADLSLDQFGLDKLDEGKISALWYELDGVSMNNGEALFTITFTALQDAAKLSDLLSLSTTDMEAFAYDKASDKRTLQLAYTNTTSTSNTLENGFKLFPNSPNPFISETTIAYRLDEASEVNLTIMDVTGKIIRQIQSNGAVSGYQAITIDHSDLEGSGVYFYKVETNQHTATGKMTLINH